MQNLTSTCRILYDNFAQTERDYRIKEAGLQREIEYLEGRVEELEEENADLQSSVDDLQREVENQNIDISDLEDQLIVIGDESREVERAHEQCRNELREVDGIIEDTYEQVHGMIRLLKERHSDMDYDVYTSMMNILLHSQSVLLRR
jgi:chromosome segregation ATPase